MASRVDVLVAGSGAAGLTAALVCAAHGLRTQVCESAPLLGGTSALSGGRVWVPGNDFQQDPPSDSHAAARYLAGIFDPQHAAMTRAFLSTAPVMARFIEQHTPHRFAPCPAYPDYHPDRPGASLGGRCLDSQPLALPDLDPLVDGIRVPHGYLPMTHAEWETWRFPARYDRELLHRRRAGRIVTGGVALVAALLSAVVRAGGSVTTGQRLVGIAPAGEGETRVTLRTAGGERTVPAGAVVLATGGYDQDPALRRRYLPDAVTASASAPSNVGDALEVCARLGAELANLGQGWWMPMLSIPGEETDGVPAFRALIRERGAPRQIVVDGSGYRFVDEAAPYHEFCKAMHDPSRTPRGEAYLVLDEGYRRRYGLPAVGADGPVPDWMVCATTVAGLASGLGVDPAGLTDQIGRWNDACARGVDDQYGKGGNAYDRYYGDPRQPGNPTLGPLDEPPYYGVRIHAGTIGSKGGPVTDADARVLDAGRRPVPGVFAVGNAAAFWTADGYPGPGATLGVGMTFGFRAGLAIAGRAHRDPRHAALVPEPQKLLLEPQRLVPEP